MARPPFNRQRKNLAALQDEANELLDSGDETAFRFRKILRALRELGVVIQNLNDNSCLEVSGSARYINRADALIREMREIVEAGCGTSDEPESESEESVETGSESEPESESEES